MQRKNTKIKESNEIYISPYSNDYINAIKKKSDLRYTHRIIKRYSFIKHLSTMKLFNGKNNFLNKWLQNYKKKIHYDFIDMELSMNNEKKFYQKEKNYQGTVFFDSILVYDIIAYENLLEFKSGLLGLLNICENNINSTNDRDIEYHFDKINKGINIGSIFNLGNFFPKNNLKNIIKSFNIQIEKTGEFFYMVSYRLYLSDEITSELRKILTSFAISQPILKKSTNKNRISVYKAFTIKAARQEAIQNLIFHIEYQFMMVLKKYVNSFFSEINVIPPVLSIYLVNDGNDLNTLMDQLDFLQDSYDYIKDSGIYINLGLDNLFVSRNKINCFIINKEIEQDYDKYKYDFYYSTQLNDLFIKAQLVEIIHSKITKHQKILNTLLTKNIKAKALLQAKKKSLQELFEFRRLIKDVSYYHSRNIAKECENDFINDSIIKISKKSRNAYQEIQYSLISKYILFEKQISGIFDFFDETLKTVESSTNLSLIRKTLVFTVLSVTASIIVPIISKNWNSIIEWIKNIFN